MPEFQFQEMFPHGEDTTPYRRVEGDFVATDTFKGQQILTVADAGLTRLAAEAIRDISHLFRPGHLAQQFAPASGHRFGQAGLELRQLLQSLAALAGVID